MFNSFMFEKRVDQFKKLQQEDKKKKILRKKHQKEIDQLVKSYNNRIHKFMVDWAEHQIEIPVYKEKEYQFRDISNKGLLGGPRFVTFGWRSERQRIEENIAKNMESTFHEAADFKKKYNVLAR